MKFEIKSVDELVTLIQVCAWAFVVLVVMLVFGGTVASMLYSVMFVGQPMKSMSPIDQAFTKMLNDIVLLMAGSISTLVGLTPTEFDEDWRAPPPPTTPPDYEDPSREDIANERAAAARAER